jgi:hypothetical protein
MTQALVFFVPELDLDYLEDSHNRRRNRAVTPLKEFSPDSVDLVKVVLLGAAGVGKTSIIHVSWLLATIHPFGIVKFISK